MKNILILVVLFLASCAQKKEINQVVEISCGQCKFELNSEVGCSLAVRFDDKSYFVDGFGIDDFGDAHHKETGFCEVIRKGNVIGTIENGRFFATSMELTEKNLK